ncbi:MAG: hypothetical protein ACRDDY_13945 [Clostridium sp.]|uniref:hypothetical protein n=1 Tax=Clostridium sp. TaxID=1506 RepID=UPI003EE6ABC1
MSDIKKNYLDENAFKPIAKIDGGKTMRLRVSLWNNCLQLGTKVGNDFLNIDITLDYFRIIYNRVKKWKPEDRNVNVALNCKKGRDNQNYGMVAFGIGDDGVAYIGGKDTRGGSVKHLFIPNVKFAMMENGQVVPDNEISYDLFMAWFENIAQMLPVAWNNSYKTAEERAYKPGQNGGQGGGQRQYGQQAPQPAGMTFDEVMDF